jgi:Raf kinase inhibitor-like YbhB/YbcL family protein
MNRTTKFLKYALYGVLAIVVLAAVLPWLAWRERQADAEFHAGIARSLTVRSADFPADGDMPIASSCRGGARSPQLSWEGGPSGTKSYAIVAIDWDAPSPAYRLASFTHWVLYDIPPGLVQIDGAVADADLRRLGIASGRNSYGQTGFAPPCPPFGKHRYVFRVYALDVAALRPRSPERAGVLEAMQGHVLAYGEVVGRFGG